MKTKAILLIVVTLIIGFLLGMLTSAQIRHTKMKQMRYYVSGKDFSEMMMEIIQPDETQRADLESVMKEFQENTRELQKSFRKDFDSLSSEFKKEIDTRLTPEQLERVRQSEAHQKEMMEKGRRQGNNVRDKYSHDHHDRKRYPEKGRPD